MRGVSLFLAVFLVLFGPFTALAQYNEEDGGIESKNGYLRFLVFGAGATYQVMNDEAVSPITYSKIGVLPVIGLVKVNPYVYTDLSLRASSLNLTHKTDDLLEAKTKTQRALADYRFLFKLPVQLYRYDLRAGGILSGMFAYKNAPHLLDASKIYEYAGSIGLCGRIGKEVVFYDKACYVSWDLSIPFFAYLSRPYYLNRNDNANPENKPFKEFFSNAATGSFGKFFRLNSRVAFMYRLENGNAIQLAYQWDYTRFKTINKAYFAEHIVSLSFMFNY